MELLVLAIGIMALGAAVLHLAIEGRKAAMAPVAATRTLPRPHLLSRIEPLRAARSAIALASVYSHADEDEADKDEADMDELDDEPPFTPSKAERFGKTTSCWLRP